MSDEEIETDDYPKTASLLKARWEERMMEVGEELDNRCSF